MLLSKYATSFTGRYSIGYFFCLYLCLVFLSVVCTPLGFARLFTVVGQFLVKPQFLRDIEEEYLVATLEEQSIERRYIENYYNLFCSR